MPIASSPATSWSFRWSATSTPRRSAKCSTMCSEACRRMSTLAPVADAKPPLGPTREIIEMDVPQSVAQFGHRGHRAQRRRFHAGLYAELYPWRRRLRLAADGGGAREARPRLLRLFQPLPLPARRRVYRQRRHQERGGRPVARGDRERAEAPCRAGPDRAGARQRQELSYRRLRAQVRDPRPASPTSCCGSRSRISASTMSASAMRWSRRSPSTTSSAWPSG